VHLNVAVERFLILPRNDIGAEPMTESTALHRGSGVPASTRRGEILAFVILAVLIWPVLAVAVVGGYGFCVWMFQVVFGPPGPPGA